MSKTDIEAQLWAAFQQDVTDSAELMERSLLAIEEAGGRHPDMLDELYRALHSFKGNSRMMGLTNIESLCHAAEDLVSSIRERQASLSKDEGDLLLETLDLLRALMADICSTRQDCSDDVVRDLSARLASVAALHSSANIEVQKEEEDLDALILFSLPPTPDESKAEPQPAPSAVGAPPKTRVGERNGTYLKVASGRVQAVIDLAAEIGLAVDAITALSTADKDDYDFGEVSHRLLGLVRELRDSATALALVPISDLLQRQRRVVRDLSRETGKEVDLEISDGDIEVDKTLVDRLADPLLHLIRNSVDHGLEPTAERKKLGKSPQGLLRLRASQQGGEVTLELEDDGRGLDREAILAKAVSKGLATPEDVLTDTQVWDLIFAPGFSTASQVSNLSGRGMGMDIVRSIVEQLRGRIEVISRPGIGTTIAMHFPLTLAFCEGMIAQVQGNFFAFPLDSIQRVFRPESSDIVTSSADGGQRIKLDGGIAPVCWLSSLLGNKNEAPRWNGHTVIVAQSSRGRLVIPVDQLIGTEQITMKPLLGVFRAIRAASACGLRNSGDVAITLDVEKLHAMVA